MKSSSTLKYLTAFLLAVAMPVVASDGVATAASSPTVELSGKESEGELLSAVAPPGAQLMHEITRVSVESIGDCIVVLFRASRESTVYEGKVLMHGTDGLHWEVTPLPAMRETDGIFDITVLSVLPLPKPSREPGFAVLYKYLRLGAGEAMRNAGYVYSWDGGQWSIDRKTSRRLVGVKNSADAQKILGL